MLLHGHPETMAKKSLCHGSGSLLPSYKQPTYLLWFARRQDEDEGSSRGAGASRTTHAACFNVLPYRGLLHDAFYEYSMILPPPKTSLSQCRSFTPFLLFQLQHVQIQ